MTTRQRLSPRLNAVGNRFENTLTNGGIVLELEMEVVRTRVHYWLFSPPECRVAVR